MNERFSPGVFAAPGVILALVLLVFFFASCSDDDVVSPSPYEDLTLRDRVLVNLERAYENRNIDVHRPAGGGRERQSVLEDRSLAGRHGIQVVDRLGPERTVSVGRGLHVGPGEGLVFELSSSGTGERSERFSSALFRTTGGQAAGTSGRLTSRDGSILCLASL